MKQLREHQFLSSFIMFTISFTFIFDSIIYGMLFGLCFAQAFNINKSNFYLKQVCNPKYLKFNDLSTSIFNYKCKICRKFSQF